MEALNTAQLEHLRYRATVNAGVPLENVEDFASRLRGTDAAEITADAVELARMFTQTRPAPTGSTAHGVDHSQGRGNRRDAAPLDPANQLRDLIQAQLGRD
ncbi:MULTISPECIES: hypothetical protein [unclassified Pseudonocardia]|uniref:hypothetical protein n=1 Tax=unclassified Pseudonocardia TaxID=2619320 RepID=UPI001CF6A23D|nr:MULTISPECIES: hypothetical protein [unclassified Pseudonocardia]